VRQQVDLLKKITPAQANIKKVIMLIGVLLPRKKRWAKVSYRQLNLLFLRMIIPTVEITCSTCQACCCRLEARIISDTGVPTHYINIDEYGNESMLRSGDGWCSALDRNTLRCSIYENRPWVCREFEMGSYECINERLKKT